MDGTLAHPSRMNTHWHLKQLHRLITPAFDAVHAAAIWREGTWQRPTTPALSLNEAAIDSLPEAQRVPKNGGIRFDSPQIAFGAEVLTLPDLATIFLISDTAGQPHS